MSGALERLGQDVRFGVAFAACWFPAQRAARVQPTVALRDE